MVKKWRLSYLPLFYDDLNEAITYIADVLENKEAANDLLNETEAAIRKRLPEADEFPTYKSSRKDKTLITPLRSKILLFSMLLSKPIRKRSWK